MRGLLIGSALCLSLQACIAPMIAPEALLLVNLMPKPGDMEFRLKGPNGLAAFKKTAPLNGCKVSVTRKTYLRSHCDDIGIRVELHIINSEEVMVKGKAGAEAGTAGFLFGDMEKRTEAIARDMEDEGMRITYRHRHMKL